MCDCGALFTQIPETITEDDNSPPVQRDELKHEDDLKKVSVIDADSRGMTVCWVLFPIRKEVWCCERLAALGPC